MTNPIEEIKNRLDIVDVIQDYIKLKKAGANFQALCPFHSENKPSFFVSPSRQMFKCFGCGKGGSIFNFVMEIEGVEFGDALRILARKAGVELKPARPEFAVLRTKRQRAYEICELACKFFQKQLNDSQKGQQVQKYLKKRGINPESRVFWRLGYAPEKWHSLSQFLKNRDYKNDEIVMAGLLIRNEQGNYYDRFRNRIMFPIFDLSSQIVGFTGRVLEDQDEKMGKYVNTPSTILYDKSRILYGLDKAKIDIRKNDNCILVEGNVDVILSHQTGVKNIAATCGTALSPFQLNILKRYSDKLKLAFDMDMAGDTATKRGIDLAQAKGFDIKVITLPSEKDPAEVISLNPEKWKEALSQAKSILDFYFENAFSKFDKQSAGGKKEISELLLPVLKIIPNKIIRFHWIQKLAKELEVREKDILDELEKTKIEAQQIEKSEPGQVSTRTCAQILEQELLFLILKHFDNINLLQEQDENFFSEKTKEILSALKKFGLDFEQLKKQLSPESFELLNVISLETEVKQEDMDFQQEFGKCLDRIKSRQIKQELKQISDEIKKAEDKREWAHIKDLAQKFNQLTKKLSV